jgi:curved DNA-binding protein CbpA
MKDYYRILGLKETATAEEIHERWIELMQKYHPDHSPDGKGNEQMAKEINEAYQALKHSSSRMEYDLERQRLRDQKKFPAWKVIISVSGLTILLIVSVFLFRKSETPVSLNQPPALPSPKVIVPRDEPARQVVSSSIPSQTEGIPKTEKPKDENVLPERIKQEHRVSSERIKQEKKIVPSTPKRKSELPPPMARSEVSKNVSPRTRSEEADHPRSVESQKPMKVPEVSEKGMDVHSAPDSGASAKKEDPSLVSKFPPSMATEEEVGKFFDVYIDRYNKKDIQGFLSLFSPKAVQNQKDGLDGIRRIYENFFYQSLELRYSVEEMRVEIYQNAVEVKARYEVAQISRVDGERKTWKGRIQWMLVREDEALKIISINYRHESSP